ncbi:MAG TPA: shikimate kinase [Armatimonadota bacterium]|jgi:shikimate kinase|nr:shikimate kinase [Armatimonadota bacterium]HOJ20379.1 shikimate kinase [Armatimonadota bacterium]HOM80455.1 shikimate kinase [Armatimonadota bacterium]HOQ29102.1 shikimate kinase [Armatimonadota bacterium]HPO74686.1 shikimate kinase [Armatimonadota bacterium]
MSNLLLIGARASGKTAVGRRAATLLGEGWGFLEMDEALVERLGMPIAEFFRVHGEEAFRREERALLEEVGRGQRRVVACGGGVAGTAESLALARATGTLVWLDTPVPELIARRLADPDEAARPALLHELAELKRQDLEGYLRVEVPTILARRQAFYAGADFTLYTAGLSVERLAQIVAALARR